MYVELVGGTTRAQERVNCSSARFLFEKCNPERVRGLHLRWRERRMADDGLEVCTRSSKRVGPEAQTLLEVLFDLAFQFGGVGRCGIERDVTAGDERFDVAEAELVKERPKVIHFDSPAVDVDGAQERDVTRNGAPPE